MRRLAYRLDLDPVGKFNIDQFVDLDPKPELWEMVFLYIVFGAMLDSIGGSISKYWWI
jgi:hypothetical protein